MSMKMTWNNPSMAGISVIMMGYKTTDDIFSCFAKK